MRLIRPRAWLAAIVLLYLVLAVLYAVYTPAWQAPDEPAHYNYVRYVAANGRFPVLQAGDYAQDYLDTIKARKFPPDLSIDPIRYESHQPPLYYALAAPVYSLGQQSHLRGTDASGFATPGPERPGFTAEPRAAPTFRSGAYGNTRDGVVELAHGALLPLRLLSVLLGAGIVLLGYRIVRRVFPARPGLALGVAAFVAFLPQHLVTVSQVGNDVLAELLFTLALLQLVNWVRAVCPPAVGEPEPASRRNRGALAIGLVLGLILITKTTAYLAVPLAGGVLVWRAWQERVPLRRAAADLALAAAPAAALACPWYVRDLVVYGWPDFLGLLRHDAVVVGQLRTADYLAQIGWNAYLGRLITTTFESFWGVFGWMGVPMDERVYTALALLCALAAGGIGLASVRRAARRAPRATVPSLEAQARKTERGLFGLLAAVALFSLLIYGWYNLQFVQFQGRYLFMALVPIGLALGLGWDEALRPASSRWLAAGLGLLTLALLVAGLATGQGIPKWPLALGLATAAALAIRPWLPRRLDEMVLALPYACLPLLALYGLFGAIVPQLA